MALVDGSRVWGLSAEGGRTRKWTTNINSQKPWKSICSKQPYHSQQLRSQRTNPQLSSMPLPHGDTIGSYYQPTTETVRLQIQYWTRHWMYSLWECQQHHQYEVWNDSEQSALPEWLTNSVLSWNYCGEYDNTRRQLLPLQRYPVVSVDSSPNSERLQWINWPSVFALSSWIWSPTITCGWKKKHHTQYSCTDRDRQAIGEAGRQAVSQQAGRQTDKNVKGWKGRETDTVFILIDTHTETDPISDSSDFVSWQDSEPSVLCIELTQFNLQVHSLNITSHTKCPSPADLHVGRLHLWRRGRTDREEFLREQMLQLHQQTILSENNTESADELLSHN